MARRQHHFPPNTRLTHQEWLEHYQGDRELDDERRFLEENSNPNLMPGMLGSGSVRRGRVVRALESATNWVRLNLIGTVAFGTTAQQSVQWQWQGQCIGVTLGARAITSQDNWVEAMSSLYLGIQIDGSNEQLVINGSNAEGAFPFSTGGIWMDSPILFRRAIHINRNWTFTIFNFHGSKSYTPDVVLHVIKDELPVGSR